MIKWIVAKITGRRLVYLKDIDGEVTLSIAYTCPWGKLYAKRFWPFKTRNVELGDNGKVINGQYVIEWMYK